MCSSSSGNACAEVFLSFLLPWLIGMLEQASQENIVHGDALSASAVFTACIVSAEELVVVSMDYCETAALS